MPRRQRIGFGLSVANTRGGANASSVVAFTPASRFALATRGIWTDPSDLPTLFQDTAGATPVTTAGQVIARKNDKSGFANHQTQATVANQPTYQTTGAKYEAHDATDFLGIGTVVLANPMDYFVAVYRVDAGNIVLGQLGNGGSPGSYFGVTISGGAGSPNTGAGTAATFYVNGVAVPGGTGTTRDQLHVATPVGAWCIVEIRDLDLSTWTAFSAMAYASLQSANRMGGQILINAQTAENRTNLRRWLGDKVGLSL